MGYRKLIILVVMIMTVVIGAVVVGGRIRAENGSTEEKIVQQLDEVLKNQSKILKQLDDIKKDLNIVKIRSAQI